MELKYFIYCRKSSEDSKRQVASINDQIDALERVVSLDNLNVVAEPFTEERSSKEPGRPVFNEMLLRIEKGEANAILCWDIDRLARNPIDNGKIQWMLQNKIIKVIKTPGREFYPEDAGLLMAIEGGRATDYIIRLSKNVKRGLSGKVAKGWRPSPAPTGYINVGEVGNKTIVPDLDRYQIVRRIWDHYLSGHYSVAQIHDMAVNKWGLTTVRRRTMGGRPISLSHLYKILHEPFYYGYFYWPDGETGEQVLHKGAHQPMITEEEYWRAQALLGDKGKQRLHTREFAYTGMMKCGECGCSITAEFHTKKQKNGNVHQYTYYRCTKKRGECSQKYLSEKQLEKQFADQLQKITIDQDYLDVALDYLQAKQENSALEEKKIRQNLQRKQDSIQTQLTNLQKEFTSIHNSDHEIFTPEEFREAKKSLIDQKKAVSKELEKASDTLDKSYQKAERVFNFCAYAKKEFNTDDLKKKRTIFSTIGSNLILKDKKLIIDKLHPYILIENELKAQNKLSGPLEPVKSIVNPREKAAFATSSPSWLRGQDSNL